MLQSTAKSSAMVPRMIWDHVVFGPKMDQKPGFLAKTLGGPLSSKLFFLAQQHSKTLKNIKNIQKHSQYARNSSSNTQGTQGPRKISNFVKNTNIPL